MARFTLTPEQIDAVFDAAEKKSKNEQVDQIDYIVPVYKLVFPDWDAIRNIDGHPTAGSEVARYTLEKAMAFDKAHFPNVFAGGNWGLSCGWSLDESLGAWEVNTDECTLHY